MIEIRYSPNGIAFQCDPERPSLRFTPGGGGGKAKAPALPPPVQTNQEIVESAQRAGEEEGRRLRKKSGRSASRRTKPELAGTSPATQAAQLKTTLGGTAA